MGGRVAIRRSVLLAGEQATDDQSTEEETADDQPKDLTISSGFGADASQ